MMLKGDSNSPSPDSLGSSLQRRTLRVLIVIPAYNEESRINLQVYLEDLQALRRQLDQTQSCCSVDILFVNDGSSDGTSRVIQQLCASEPSFSLLDLPVNSGKAEAVRRGFVKALDSGIPIYDFIGYWDADLATPLAEVENLMLPLLANDQIQVAMGSRVKLLGRDIQRRPLRHYFGRIFATFVSLTLDLAVYDTQCGAKIFRTSEALRKTFSQTFVSRWIFDVEILARLRSHGVDLESSIVEVPLRRWVDVAGSKVRMRDFLRAGMELLKIAKIHREKPLRAIGNNQSR
jgi:glycosyltransferase involved in cell wall biosynthesis